jgi:predicted RND superfamily exporter protein
MLAVDITVVPSHRNVKIRESIKNMIRGLGLPSQLLMSAILLTLVAMTGFGIFSLKDLAFETTPVRFLQNSNATQRELSYFNSMLGGPEMIDVEATLKDPSQNFFLSSPLKTLNEVQKRFGDRFQASVSRSVSIADYFKELHKAFTPGVTAENSMPEKEEDYKNYADLLELSDGKMLGKMLTIDKSRARMMISRRLVGWDVPDANAFIDEEIPKIARGEMDFKVAGLAGFIRELDKICRSHSEVLMYGFVLMLALVAGVASRSLAMAGIMSSVTLLSYGVPMIGAKLIGIPLDMSTVVGQSSVALVCLTAMAPIIASFRRPKSKHGDSSRAHLWQAAVDGAPEVLASAPLIGIICASLWFSGIWAFGRQGFLVFGSAVCAASVLAILLPLMTRTHDSQNASSSKRENEQRRSHAA